MTASLFHITLEATSINPRTRLIDGRVTLQSLNAIGTITAGDTIKIRHQYLIQQGEKRLPTFIPLDLDAIFWKFEGFAFTPTKTPSAEISITATDADSGLPVPGADVRVNDLPYGRTSATGNFVARVPAGTNHLRVSQANLVSASEIVTVASGERLSRSFELASKSGMHEVAELTYVATPGPMLSPDSASLRLLVTSSGRLVSLRRNRILTIDYEDGGESSLVTPHFALQADGSLELSNSSGMRAIIEPGRIPRRLNVFGVDAAGLVYEVEVLFAL